MGTRKQSFSIGRSILDYFRRGPTRKYAIEVNADHADEFDLPEAQICDSWENGDGSVVFVIQSRTGVAALTRTMEGVRSVRIL